VNIAGKGFKGQRSKVKVIARPNGLLRRRYTFGRCDVEARLLFCRKLHDGKLQFLQNTKYHRHTNTQGVPKIGSIFARLNFTKY